MANLCVSTRLDLTHRHKFNDHGGYYVNCNVSYVSHNIADAEPSKKQWRPLWNNDASSGYFHIGVDNLDGG